MRITLVTDFFDFKVKFCKCINYPVEVVLIIMYVPDLLSCAVFGLPLSNVLNSLADLFVAADMGVTARPLLLVCAYLAAALIGGTRSEGVCLQDGKHKATPSPEPHLRECGLYADSE